MGLRGRWDGGGEPGSSGLAGLMVGTGDVLRCWRMLAIVCKLCQPGKSNRTTASTDPLRNTLLAMAHQQIGDLFHHRIVTVLDMAARGKWERRHSKLQARRLWRLGSSLHTHTSLVRAAAPTRLGCRG